MTTKTWKHLPAFCLALLASAPCLGALEAPAAPSELTSFLADSDQLKGGTSFVMVVQSRRVRVGARDLGIYKIILKRADDDITLTEIGDGRVLSHQRLPADFDFQLMFFGEDGYMVKPTAQAGDFRVVEGLDDDVQAKIDLRVEGGQIFLGDGSGPMRSWKQSLVLTGQKETVTEAISKRANDTRYFSALIQDETPLIKFFRIRGRFASGEIPELAKDNLLVRGPGGFVTFVSVFLPSPAEDVVDALSSISDNLTDLNERLAETNDANLQSIYKEVVAAKVFKLIRCIEVGLTGKINNDAFDECVDEIDDLGEAISETPDCGDVCAHKTFSMDRCNPDAANSFDDIDVMDELCDVHRDFRPEVVDEDNSAGAEAFVKEIERNLAKLAEKIWKKILAYCKCP